MSVTADDSARSYRLTAIALIAISIVGHAVYLRKTSNPDLEMFVYMGKLVATGGRPGIDLIDNKFPTVGLLMSVPYRLIGANWRGYGLLSLAATISAAFILARGAGRLFGTKSYWPTLVAAMVWGNFFLCIFSLFQLEHLQLLLVAIAGVAALYAIRDEDWRDAFVVGLCAGLAAWCKPNALSVLGAFGGVMLFSGRSRWKLLAAAMAGVAVPTLVAGWCLHLSGTLELLPEITQQIGRYAGHSAWNGSEIVSKLVDLAFLFALPFAITLLPLLVLGERAGERVFGLFSASQNQRRWDPLPNPLPEYKEREVAFLLLWLTLEFLGGLAQGRLFPYYFLPLAAPAALLFGRYAHLQKATRLFAAFAAPLAIACIGVVILFNNTGGIDDRQTLAAYLNTHNLAGGKIWVDDYPRLAVETDWTPASRMPLINLLTNDDDAPTHFGNLLLNDLTRNQPQLLILKTDEAKVIRFFTRTQQDVAASPIRARRMTDAIEAVYRFATIGYRCRTDVGPYTIWEKRSDAETATASVSPLEEAR